MRELQLELAGEYLLMAATLAEIKSRMLLPRRRVKAWWKRTRAPSWCGACRNTSASSRRDGHRGAAAVDRDTFPPPPS